MLRLIRCRCRCRRCLSDVAAATRFRFAIFAFDAARCALVTTPLMFHAYELDAFALLPGFDA